MLAALQWFQSRQGVAWTSLVAGLIGLVWLLGQGVVDDVSYGEALALWFASCLAFCHAYFAFRSHLTEKQAKLIDYPYLGIAAVGLILFAAGYDQERRVAQQGWYDNLVLGTQREKAGALSSIQMFIRRACQVGSNNFEARADACSKARELATFLSEEHPMMQLHIKWSEMRSVFEQVTAAGKSEVIAAMDLYIGSRLAIAVFEPSAHEEIEGSSPRQQFARHAGLKFTQFVIWPFLLLMALALRLTKVTIEVFGWASRS